MKKTINGHLKGLLIIIFALVLIAVDLVLMIIAFKGNISVGYKKSQVLALLGALLFLLLLWLFYGIIILFVGEKKSIKKDEKISKENAFTSEQAKADKVKEEKMLASEQNDNSKDVAASVAKSKKKK